MDYLEILRIAIWPLFALVIVFIFRKQLREMIRNIADFSITKDGFSARVGRAQSTGDSAKVDKPAEKDVNEKYLAKEHIGEVAFNYSNNNGVYTIGEGHYRFDTQWSKASREYIHFYNDQPTIKSVRLAKNVSNLDDVRPDRYDSSSRARTAGIGQIAVFENIHGKFLAVKILALRDDSRGDLYDELHFQYKILF